MTQVTINDELADVVLQYFNDHRKRIRPLELALELQKIGIKCTEDEAVVICKQLRDYNALNFGKFGSRFYPLTGYHIHSHGIRIVLEGGWLVEAQKILKEKREIEVRKKTQDQLTTRQLASLKSSSIRSKVALLVSIAAFLWSILQSII